MTNSHLDKIRTVYRIMEKHNVSLGFYEALNFADEIATFMPDPSLEELARNSALIEEYANSGRRIMAIKELRSMVPGTGLKEAKDAFEAVYGPYNARPFGETGRGSF